MSAVCGDIPLYGAFLRTLGFCNPDTDELHVFGGALLDALDPTEALVVGALTVTSPEGRVRVDVDGGIDPTAHRWALLLLGPDGAPLALDYGTGTVADDAGVEVPVRSVPAGSRVLLLADGVVAGEAALP